MKFFYPWGGNTAPSNSAVNYDAVYGGGNFAWSATENTRDTVVSSSFTLNKMYVALDVAPGAGTQYAFTLRKNGADTALAVTIADASLTATNINQAVSFSAGDTIAIKCTPTGTPSAPTMCYGYFEGYAGDKSFPVLGGTNNAISASATNFLSPLAGRGAWQAADNLTNQVVPIAGTLRALRVRLSASPGTGKSIALTIYKNGAPTSLSVTISDSATTGTDSSNTVSLVAGDTISIASIPTNTPATPTVRWGLEFVPTTNGESFLGYVHTSVGSQSTTYYEQPNIGGGWNATENLRQVPVPATSFKNIYVLVGTAPGGAASRTFSVRLNAADTALTTAITGAATTGNATSTVTSSANDLMSLSMAPASTPAVMTNGARVSVCVYYAPSTNTGAGFLTFV